MRSTYRYLALAIPILVALQAAFIAFGMFGLSHWVDSDGGTLDKSTEDSAKFTGDAGFVLHGLVGIILIPLVVLALLVVSFFAAVPRGRTLALYLVGDTVLQIVFVMLAYAASPFFGLLHGLNALVLAGLGVMTFRVASGGMTARADAAVV